MPAFRRCQDTLWKFFDSPRMTRLRLGGYSRGSGDVPQGPGWQLGFFSDVLSDGIRVFRTEPIKVLHGLLDPEEHVCAAGGYRFAEPFKLRCPAPLRLQSGNVPQIADRRLDAQERLIKKIFEPIVEAAFIANRRLRCRGAQRLHWRLCNGISLLADLLHGLFQRSDLGVDR